MDHALRILEAIDLRGEIRVSEAAEVVGVARSSAHRLLATLRHRGFVEQDSETRVYRLGPVLVAMALRAYDGLDLRRLSRPHLERLCDEIDETVHLVVLEGDDAKFLEGVECSQLLRVALQVGRTIPAWDTAGGRALLAAMGDAAVLSADAPASLGNELRETRERGYARHFRTGSGVIGVGVAIRDTLGVPLAALAMAAPHGRMPEPRMARIAETVTRTAHVIENEVRNFRRMPSAGH